MWRKSRKSYTDIKPADFVIGTGSHKDVRDRPMSIIPELKRVVMVAR